MTSKTRAPRRTGNDTERVLEGIRRLVRMLRLATRAAEKQWGISAAQLFVLQKLEDSAAPSLAELAKRTMTDQSSVSVVVSRLVERGLVRRVASAADGRRAEIKLTPLGRKVSQRAPEPIQVQLIKALEQMPKREVAGLAKSLMALLDRVEVAPAPAPMLFEDDAAEAKDAGHS
jgi:DNA-binding MarR family transcriptional regulator